jgi:MFS family permease
MFEYLRTFGRLNREVKLYLLGFGLTSFAYFGIMGVLFNLYLVRLGFGAEFIGLLIGSGQLVWAVMALPAGAIGMRIGLARALTFSQVLVAAGFSLVLLVEWLPRPLWEGWLIVAWMILWIGAALLTVNGVPFVMAATNAAERKHAFSLQQALMALLTFTGSLVAGALPGLLAGWMGTTLDDPAPYRLTLWLAPLTFALAGSLFWAMRPVVVQADEDDHRQRSAAPLGLFIFFTVMVFLMSIGEGAVRNFFNLYLDRELHVATAQIGAAMGVPSCCRSSSRCSYLGSSCAWAVA